MKRERIGKTRLEILKRANQIFPCHQLQGVSANNNNNNDKFPTANKHSKHFLIHPNVANRFRNQEISIDNQTKTTTTMMKIWLMNMAIRILDVEQQCRLKNQQQH